MSAPVCHMPCFPLMLHDARKESGYCLVTSNLDLKISVLLDFEYGSLDTVQMNTVIAVLLCSLQAYSRK